MGLHVVLYTNIKEVKTIDESDFQAFVIDDRWWNRMANLKRNGLYSGDKSKIYTAYPYSMHTTFREFLLVMIDRADLLSSEGGIDWTALDGLDIPFIELIDFADNEGCFDWATAYELFPDFVKYLDKARHLKAPKWFLEIYNEWIDILTECVNKKGVIVYR